VQTIAAGYTWAFRYRFAGKTRKITYGTYPETTLATARAHAESAVEDLENKIDPARTKANEEAARQIEVQAELMQQESVAKVAEEFIKRGLKPKEKERGEAERIIRREIIAQWKHRGIADIRKPDVLSLLDVIVDRGASVMACRTRGVMLRFFKWSKGRGYIEQSPMIDVPKPGPDNEDRERVLEPEELVEVLSVLDGLGYPGGPFMRLQVLTGQRRGECATMKWKDVDLQKRLWTLPAEATKNGCIHYVPLSKAAVELLEALPRFEGEYVWTTTSGQKPINGFSKLKQRIDEKTLENREKNGINTNIPDWTLHDIRRTATTLMAERCHFPEHILTRILNHTPEGPKISKKLKLYNRYSYLEEKRQALESWAEYVVSLTENKSAMKVVTA
jgi:integrase